MCIFVNPLVGGDTQSLPNPRLEHLPSACIFCIQLELLYIILWLVVFQISSTVFPSPSAWDCIDVTFINKFFPQWIFNYHCGCLHPIFFQVLFFFIMNSFSIVFRTAWLCFPHCLWISYWYFYCKVKIYLLSYITCLWAAVLYSKPYSVTC